MRDVLSALRVLRRAHPPPISSNGSRGSSLKLGTLNPKRLLQLAQEPDSGSQKGAKTLTLSLGGGGETTLTSDEQGQRPGRGERGGEAIVSRINFQQLSMVK